MKHIFPILFFFLTINSYGQVNENLIGSWVKIAEESYDGTVFEKMNDESLSYLKYTFLNNGNLYISTHYSYKGDFQRYSIKNNTIEMIFNRKFLIEKNDSENLVLLELENGKITSNSTRYRFVKEQKYLDMLALAPNCEYVLENDTVYIESEKLYPRFINEQYSNDFHIYIQNYIKKFIKDEFYSYVTFIINPKGYIENINILHHVNEHFDKQLIKAIKKSKGMWHIPNLNGKSVSILKLFEERNILYNKKESLDISNLSSPNFSNYSMEYFENFNLIVRNLLSSNYINAIEYINKCDQIIQNEPNLLHLKYLCYKSIGNLNLSEKNLDLLKKTKLKYITE